jgi:hypothetical protein
MVALPVFLLSGDSHFGGRHVANFVAWGFAIPGLVLAWYAAVTYIPRARVALAAGRVGSEA